MQSHDWYKTAIMYALDVDTFYDSNGDGIGDLRGVISKLDYIRSLGFDLIWLLPFYPSPGVDNHYDVKDYYNVDEKFGSMDDFLELVQQAEQRGIRILIDLVINHTSIEHPWFQKSRSDKNSRYRNYYVWTENPTHEKEKVVFEGVEHSIWEYDEKAEAYYLHRFFKEQPDLNISNPEVRKEILKIMDFWLDKGVWGFRVDAAHVLTDPFGIEKNEEKNLNIVLREMRDFINKKKEGAVLLGEVNVPKKDLAQYFKDGNKLHMLFNFMLNKHLFLAMASEKSFPLQEGLDEVMDIPHSHWVNFMRHHDELNLEMLSDQERKIVFKAFAPDEDMRIFGHGIRRRLPPMLEGDRKRLELMYSLMFSIPGTPLVCYGEEIAMGDDLSLEGRQSVRTPMQWSAGKNGGFSSAEEEKLVIPVIKDGSYSYQKVNVEAQENDPDSFLNWIKKVVAVRKENSFMGAAEIKIIKTPDISVFIALCVNDKKHMLTLHNFSAEPLTIKIPKQYISDGIFREIFSDGSYLPEENIPLICRLNGYGYRWFIN